MGDATVTAQATGGKQPRAPTFVDRIRVQDKSILTLLNDAVTQYEAHRVTVSPAVHGAADATNVITVQRPATTEAEAVALVNDLKTQYEAHRVLTAGAVHGAADNTNSIAAATATDWASVLTLVNEFKNTTGYEDHRVLTAGGVHGVADTVNAITAADAGYPQATGGYPLGLSTLLPGKTILGVTPAVVVGSDVGTAYDRANDKLKLYVVSSGAEVANATEAGDLDVELLVISN